MQRLKARIVKSTGKEYEVVSAEGIKKIAVIRGNLRTRTFKSTNPVAIGDFVWIEFDENDDKAFITDIDDRKNFIIRKSAKLSKQYQILAANINQAFLMVTLENPRTSTTFIDRFLATAEAYSIPVILLFNKIDLYTSEELKAELFFIKSVYKSLGYNIVEMSITGKINVEKVEVLAKEKVSLISGHSGTGKSSLIKTLIPGVKIETGDLSEHHRVGQNTTSASQMYSLPSGGYLIDTPGIKGFGLFDFDKSEISHFFKEIFKEGQKCTFDNCTHTHEANCAVKQAVEDGKISITRYESYLDVFFDENEKYRKPF